jgi:hypothetical protein
MNKNVDNTVVRTKSPLFQTFLTAQNVGALTGLILSELILIPVEPTIYHRTYHRISQI